MNLLSDQYRKVNRVSNPTLFHIKLNTLIYLDYDHSKWSEQSERDPGKYYSSHKKRKKGLAIEKIASLVKSQKWD